VSLSLSRARSTGRVKAGMKRVIVGINLFDQDIG
jgi:hypothetical protein